jgi:YD repeat-containing protein
MRVIYRFLTAAALLAFGITPAQAQQATYHLHNETSSTAGRLQLKPTGPDTASAPLQTIDLRNQTGVEFVIKEFDTQGGVPGITGTIPAGSTLSFTLWMKRTGTAGTFYPRVRVKLNSGSGTQLCEANTTTALTATLTAFALSCPTSSTLLVSSTDRFYLWAGVRVGTTAGNQSARGELDVEGTLNGNYDSRVVIPLPGSGPALTSLTPANGIAGQSVVLAGVNFGATQATSNVTFNGVPAQVTTWSATTVTAVVPPGATAGPALIWINAQPSNGLTFTIPTVAVINSLSTVSGSPGQSVTISGTAFGVTQGPSTVSFAGAIAAVTNWSDTSITVSVPGAATSGSVVVQTNGQSSDGVFFRVMPAPGPSTVYHLHKEGSTTAGLFQVKTASPDGTSVALQTVDLKSLTPADFLVKEFDTPIGVPGQNAILTAASTLTFTLWMKATTTNGSIVPHVRTRLNNATGASICEASAGSLTTTLSAVTLSCAPTTDIALTSSDRLYVWVGVTLTSGPGNKSLRGELDVEGTLNGNYDSRLTLPGVIGPPVITSVTPVNGVVGTSVTVAGSNFGALQNTSTLKFNGITATPSAWSDTSLAATVPAGATSGPVTVNVLQSSNTTVAFTVFGALTGIVTQSTGAPMAGATLQALQGGVVKGTAMSNGAGSYTIANLIPGNYDLTFSLTGFNPQARSNVAVVSGSTVSQNFAIAATGTMTYAYDSLNRLVGVTDPVAGSASYTYDAVGNVLSIQRTSAAGVSILSVSPTSAGAGQLVTIEGFGFSANPGANTVSFNGAPASVLSSTSTEVVATVPVAATTGPITITSPAGSAASLVSFLVTDGGLSTITGFTPSSGQPGDTVTISGTNFHTIDTVRFNGVVATIISATPTALTVKFPQAGSGRITVTSPNGSAVSATDFIVPPQGYVSSSQPIAVVSRVGIGQSVNVSLPATQNGLVLFEGQAGQRVVVYATNVTFQPSTTCFGQTAFILIDVLTVTGAQAPSESDLDGCNFSGPHTLPATGTYTVYLSGDFQGSAGSATITVSEIADKTGSIAINHPGYKTMTTDVPGQAVRWTFQGVAGEPIMLYASEFPSCGFITIRVSGPNNESVLVMAPCYAAQPTATLPVTGTYTITTSSPYGRTGAVGVKLSSP